MHHGHEGGGCGGCGNHCTQAVTPEQELRALLLHMLGHNRDHADQLRDLVVRADDLGMTEASREIEAAIADYKKGNDRLAAALLHINI